EVHVLRVDVERSGRALAGERASLRRAVGIDHAFREPILDLRPLEAEELLPSGSGERDEGRRRPGLAEVARQAEERRRRARDESRPFRWPGAEDPGRRLERGL